MSQEKTVLLPPPSKTSRTIMTEKPKKKRVIFDAKSWQFSETELTAGFQYQILASHCFDITVDTDASFALVTILQQINSKIGGYKCQDLDKGFFDVGTFVDLSYVLQSIIDCGGRCFYCKEPVVFLYEQVRDPNQWTLERLDNSLGHNRGNVQIACLNCNLRRRTMYHERFLFTKQLVISRAPTE
jgi:hypothetical protein